MLLACAVLATVGINYIGLISIFGFGILNYNAVLFLKAILLILCEWTTEKNIYVGCNVA